MFKKWPDIEGLHHIVRGFQVRQEKTGMLSPIIKYKTKIKLDGTNAAVRVNKTGKITAQSRTRDVSISDDNEGFARWLFSNTQSSDFYQLAKRSIAFNVDVDDVIFHGEWAGKGVQNRTAISKIDGKVFCVFAVEYVKYNEDGTVKTERLLVDLDAQNSPFKEIDFTSISGCQWINWHNSAVLTLDYSNTVQLQSMTKVIEDEVLRVEACDPWVKEKFGIEDVGEGLVYYPVTENVEQGFEDRELISRLMFKAKGEKHRVNSTKSAVQIAPEVLTGVAEFVNAFATVPRFEQAASVTGPFEMKKIGDFIKWVNTDIQKESKLELEASNLVWKQVSNQIAKAAKDWYLEKIKSLL